MNLNDISDDDITSVLEWYYERNVAKTRLKKEYWKRKGKALRKKLGWKFYMILQRMTEEIGKKGAT